MKLIIEYNVENKKLYVSLLFKKQRDLPLRDINYYAFKSLIFFHFDDLSKEPCVIKVLEDKEYLEREYHHALEATFNIKAHWFLVDNKTNANLIMDKMESFIKNHYSTIENLSKKNNELTKKTHLPLMIIEKIILE